jgi:hypothetical protein
VPVYGIDFDVSGAYTFPAAIAGYGAQTAKSVTITNTGNQATGDLTVALFGTNAGSFTLSTTAVSSIAAGGTGAFTVAPNTGLAEGTYTATVTVSGANGITANFDVSFTVSPTVTFGSGPQAEDLGNLGNPAASISWQEGESLTAVVDTSAGTWANGAAFAWYMDGMILSGQTSAAITINATSYTPGTHTLAVKVTKNGESYSKTAVFTMLPGLGGGKFIKDFRAGNIDLPIRTNIGDI